MSYHAGLDVSLEHTSVCVIDQDGSIHRESKVATDPYDMSALFGGP